MKTCRNCRYARKIDGSLFCYGERGRPLVSENSFCDGWMMVGLNDYERGRWEMFMELSSSYYGSPCYCMREDPDVIFSSLTGKCTPREDAYLEFKRRLQS